MAKNTEIEFGYRITKIQSLKFSFNEIDENVLAHLFESKGGLGISILSQLNVNKEESAIVIDICTELVKKDEGLTLVEHIGRTKYQVIGLESVYDPKTDIFNLPDDFIILISSIAYTHARALLTVELSSTCYRDKYFLPVINPSQVFQPTSDTLVSQ